MKKAALVRLRKEGIKVVARERERAEKGILIPLDKELKFSVDKLQ